MSRTSSNDKMVFDQNMLRGRDKSPQPRNTAPLLGVNRAYTMGNKINARKMFVFNEDGTIKGLANAPDPRETAAK